MSWWKKITLAIIVIPITFLFGFYHMDIVSGRMPERSALTNLIRPDAIQTPAEIFQTNYNYILSNFGGSVDGESLKHAGISGLVASLQDPHTNYLEPKIAESFNIQTKGDFVGIGARLTQDPLGASVYSVFDEAPAHDAGLKAGDVITHVDGKSMAGEVIDDIVELIKGDEGTKVTLTVLREGKSQPIRVVRKRVYIPTVEGKMLPNKVGYISILGFSEPTALQFQQAWEDLSKQGVTSLVIDLRGNPGGLLNSAQDILSYFVEDKTVLTMKGRDGASERVLTHSGRLLGINVPIAILVNDESASAAEIMSGVLQDYGKAILVGDHTYGKASVQDLYPLPGDASLKVTIARYYLPSGRDISRKIDEDGSYISGGLAPDIKEELKINQDTRIGVPGHDSQLDRAIEALRQKLSF